MFRRLLLSFAVAVLLTVVAQVGQAEAQQRGFGQSWGGHSSKQNRQRFVVVGGSTSSAFQQKKDTCI